MSLKFFNTLSKKEEIIEPNDSNHLKFYVCGPTVYDRPHLGNARSVVVYDMFYRLAKQVFNKVTYVRNITDVDDKINAAAKERQISIQKLTAEITDLFYQDIDDLNVLRPDFEPKATNHIAEMIAMIESLIAKNHAYVSNSHVLFDVKSYQDYGKLSNRNIDEMIAGARIEIADYKRDPLDFVLWKPSDSEDDQSSVFDSPWGKGRPGWHIECSAMSSKYLGVNFDVHGGGADLQFPHHENEIAQSRCANSGSNYAKYWIHNGFLTVDGEKMSKSLKNFITVRDLLNQGIKGIVIRYLLLTTHYRKPLDFNQKALEDAQKSIDKFYSVFSRQDLIKQNFSQNKQSEFLQQIIVELSNDLNISKVIALLHDKFQSVKKDESQKAEFLEVLDFLGLMDSNFFATKQKQEIDEGFILSQIELRKQAKQDKDFAKADEIRKNLLAQGIVLEDVAGGKTLWRIV